jgi:hypothetical protein
LAFDSSVVEPAPVSPFFLGIRLASKNPDHTVIIQKTTKTEIFIIGMCRRPHCEKCDGSGLADLALIFDSQLKA